MAKIKEIRCDETGVVSGSSCKEVFTVSSIDQLKENMIHHYMYVQPHTSESSGMFNFKGEAEFKAGVSEQAKVLFEQDTYGKVIKNS